MAPQLSVVVAGSRPQGPPDALFRALGALLENGTVELLLATARPDAQTQWPGTRVVQCASGSNVPAMRLAGIRAAKAPLIAMTEDFCIPSDGWAESLLRARARVDAAVLGGPIARRDGTAADWALTFAEYGRFFRRTPEGEVRDLPSINVAYDADRLRSVLPPDAVGLVETQIHAQLRMQGARFWRVPDAVMLDENTRPFADAARAQYYHGRLFGGGRVEGKGLIPRAIRSAMACLVPLVLFHRILRETGAAGVNAKLLRALPALLLLLIAWSIGEAMGSLIGKGQSAARWT